MTDFARFELASRAVPAGSSVSIRPATFADIASLSVVMAARGGTSAGHREQAHRFIDRLPVLTVAQMGDNLVGYSGAQPFVIEAGREPEWLVAGLTVVPAQRRRGIAARLLRAVIDQVHRVAPGAPISPEVRACF